MLHPRSRVLVGVWGGLLLARVAAAQPYDFTIVQEVGQVVDGRTIDSMGDPSLNDLGSVIEDHPILESTGACGQSTDRALIRDGTTVELETCDAIEPGAIPTGIGRPRLNDAGVAVSVGTLTNGHTAVFTQNNVVFEQDDLACGGAITLGGPLGNPGLNDNGVVVTSNTPASGALGCLLTANTDGSNKTCIACEGDVLSGGLCNRGPVTMSSDPSPAIGIKSFSNISNAGQIAWVADYGPVPGNVEALFVNDSMCISEGDVVDSETLTDLREHHVNTVPTLHGIAALQSGGEAILRRSLASPTDPPEILLRTGEEVGCRVLQSGVDVLQTLRSNNSDLVTFSGNTAPSGNAIFAITGPGSVATGRVAGTGDEIIPGFVVMNVGSPYPNDNGQIAFNASLEDLNDGDAIGPDRMVVVLATPSANPDGHWPCCGNGYLDQGEECDDGARSDGDGCSIACLSETCATDGDCESVTEEVTAFGAVGTDDEADGATPADTIETTVTTPAEGVVGIVESVFTGPPPPAGFTFLDRNVEISAPVASPVLPLDIVFELHASLVSSPELPRLNVFRNSELVRACAGPWATPDPCRWNCPDSVFGNPRVCVRSSAASLWTLGVGGCTFQPMTGCRQAARSVLLLKDSSNDQKDLLAWTWAKGEAASVGDLGDPLLVAGPSYAVCFYDESQTGSDPDYVTELLRATALAGAECGGEGEPCWKGLGKPAGSKGFKYRSPDGSPEGLTKLLLKPGEDGKTKVLARLKGERLAMLGEPAGGSSTPALPLALPVRVQLQSSYGECWESAFDTTHVKKNDADKFKAVVAQ